MTRTSDTSIRLCARDIFTIILAYRAKLMRNLREVDISQSGQPQMSTSVNPDRIDVDICHTRVQQMSTSVLSGNSRDWQMSTSVLPGHDRCRTLFYPEKLMSTSVPTRAGRCRHLSTRATRVRHLFLTRTKRYLHRKCFLTRTSHIDAKISTHSKLGMNFHILKVFFRSHAFAYLDLGVSQP